jgi:hypothetical protein
MFNTNDPGVMWLVITNFAMGAVVLVCCLLLGGAIVRELLARVRNPATHPSLADDHAFQLPELGLTMADGGEREDTPSKKNTSDKR